MSELDKKLMQTPDLNKERLDKLKNLFPDLFTAEGKLNPDELKKIVDPDLVKETERFEFKWFGKSEAKRNAFTPGKATLVYDEERSVNPEYADGNMIIEGENLETLKCLLAGYRERIKCIYIDPPYNTGSDFVYSDRWDESREDYWEHIGVMQDGVKVDTNTTSSGRFHSYWLNMMYSRLLLARQLLKDDGVIFMSIDDNEVHHLRKICNELFGEENFITQIVWEKKYTRSNDAKYFSDNHDHILVYAKIKDCVKINLQERSEEQEEAYSNPDNHLKGNWKATPLHAKSGSNSDFIFTFKNGHKWSPPPGTFSRYSVETLNELDKNDEIYFGSDGKSVPSRKSFLSEVKAGVTPVTLWRYADVGHTHEANNELKKLELAGIFDNPKPTRLIRQIVNLVSDYDSIILDFFAGSGTSAHSIIELNREDSGNRKYILVQLPELTDEKSEARKAGYNKISDITIERNRRVIQKIEKEEAEKQPQLLESDKKPFKTGFKVYKLAKSNFPRIDFAPDPKNNEEENLALLNNYIQDKEAMFLAVIDEKNIFDEVLLKNGFMLNYSKVKEDAFSKNKVYRIKDDFKECLICMDMALDKQTLKDLESYKETIFICLERSLDTTMKWNLKHLLGDKLIAF